MAVIPHSVRIYFVKNYTKRTLNREMPPSRFSTDFFLAKNVVNKNPIFYTSINLIGICNSPI